MVEKACTNQPMSVSSGTDTPENPDLRTEGRRRWLHACHTSVPERIAEAAMSLVEDISRASLHSDVPVEALQEIMHA